MGEYSIEQFDELDVNYHRTLKVLLSVGVLACPSFLVFYLFVGDTKSAMDCALGVVAFLLLGFYYRRTSNFTIALHATGLNTYLVLTALVFHQGGFSSPTLWWLLLVPLMFLACGRNLAAYTWTILIVVTVTYFYVSPYQIGEAGVYAEFGMEYRGAIMSGLFIVMVVFLSYVERSRKEAMARVIETSRGLRHAATALQQSHLDIEKARDEALEQADMKSRLMANISHELRTPLTGVLASIDLLALSSLSKDQEELVESMASSSQHFIEIINDVLDYSKLEAGMMNLEVAPVRLHALLDDVTELLRIEAQSKGLEFNLSVAPGSPARIDIDDKRLRQIITNLVSNAIKFTDKGKITVEVQFSRWQDGEKTIMRLSVTDTGVGIPLESQEQLFNAFYQVDSSLSRSAGGSGLGLAICADLAQLMGGEIWVHSEPGAGSQFSCELPVIARKPAGEREQPSVPLDSAAADKTSYWPKIGEALPINKILVVDDEPLNRSLLQNMLTRLGYHSDPASNGKEAVEAVKNNVYELIFMDCRMPVMDGIEATRLIRAQENPTGQIVALTGDAQEGIRHQCLEAGVNMVMSKPYRFSDIQDVLSSVRTARSPSEKISCLI